MKYFSFVFSKTLTLYYMDSCYTLTPKNHILILSYTVTVNNLLDIDLRKELLCYYEVNINNIGFHGVLYTKQPLTIVGYYFLNCPSFFPFVLRLSCVTLECIFACFENKADSINKLINLFRLFKSFTRLLLEEIFYYLHLSFLQTRMNVRWQQIRAALYAEETPDASTFPAASTASVKTVTVATAMTAAKVSLNVLNRYFFFQSLS